MQPRDHLNHLVESGLFQPKDLGKAAKCDPKTIHNWRTGKTPASIKKLDKMSVELGFASWDLLCQAYPMSTPTLGPLRTMQVSDEAAAAYRSTCLELGLDTEKLLERFLVWVAEEPQKPFQILGESPKPHIEKSVDEVIRQTNEAFKTGKNTGREKKNA